MDQRADTAAPAEVRPRPAAVTGGIETAGLALALAGSFLYSLKPIFIKLSFGYGIDVPTQMVLRMGIALPFYLAIGWWSVRKRRERGEPVDLSPRALAAPCAVGILGYYVASLLDLEGLARITAQFERLILFTYPTFVALIGYVWFRERLTRASLIALGLTYAGLAAIFIVDLRSLGTQVATGALLVVACSITYALYLLLSKAQIARLGTGLFTCVSMVSATVPVGLHFLLVQDVSALVVPWPALGLSFGVAVLSTVIPYLTNEAIARIGPGPASIAGGIGPVFTVALSVMLLGEAFGVAHLAGTLLVIAGVFVLGRSRR